MGYTPLGLDEVLLAFAQEPDDTLETSAVV
jgi:hypothetical protein